MDGPGVVVAPTLPQTSATITLALLHDSVAADGLLCSSQPTSLIQCISISMMNQLPSNITCTVYQHLNDEPFAILHHWYSVSSSQWWTNCHPTSLIQCISISMMNQLPSNITDTMYQHLNDEPLSLFVTSLQTRTELHPFPPDEL